VEDVDTRLKLLAAVPLVSLVVNTGTDTCPTVDYGDGIRTITIDGLLGDPEPLKRVDMMEEGPQKAAARAALPAFPPAQCAGDARKDFERVNGLIDGVLREGGDCLIHSRASLSRNVVFYPGVLDEDSRLLCCRGGADDETEMGRHLAE